MPRLGWLVAPLLLALLAGTAAGKGKKPAKPPPRVYLEPAEITADAALGKRGKPLVRLATAELDAVLADHPRVVIAADADAPELAGADVAAALKRARLAGAYAVHLVILACTEHRADGQLTVTIEVDVAGAALPGDRLTFSARAAATIGVEVRGELTPALRDRTIRQAIALATTDALSKGIEKVAPSSKRRRKK